MPDQMPSREPMPVTLRRELDAMQRQIDSLKQQVEDGLKNSTPVVRRAIFSLPRSGVGAVAPIYAIHEDCKITAVQVTAATPWGVEAAIVVQVADFAGDSEARMIQVPILANDPYTVLDDILIEVEEDEMVIVAIVGGDGSAQNITVTVTLETL